VVRVVVTLLIALVAQMLVATASPCCCIRAAQAAAQATARGQVAPKCPCCRKGEKTPSRGPKECDDCHCRPDDAQPAGTDPVADLGSTELACSPIDLCLSSAWVPVESPRALPLVCASGPPPGPSSCSPSLLPVLRI